MSRIRMHSKWFNPRYKLGLLATVGVVSPKCTKCQTTTGVSKEASLVLYSLLLPLWPWWKRDDPDDEVQSVVPSARCRFPAPEAAKQPQSITEPPPSLTVGTVFRSACAPFFLLQTRRWSIDQKSAVLVHRSTESPSQSFYVISWSHIDGCWQSSGPLIHTAFIGCSDGVKRVLHFLRGPAGNTSRSPWASLNHS